MDFLQIVLERYGPWIAVLIIGVVTWSRNSGTSDRIVTAFTNTNTTLQESMSKIAQTMTQQNISANERNVLLEKMLADARSEIHQQAMQTLELRATLTDTALALGHKERELQDAQDANSALKAARDELGSQFATLSADVGALTSKLETVEAELSEAVEHITALEGQQQSMKAELEEAKRLREEAERINRELTKERDRLAVENQSLTQELAQYKEEVRVLRGKLEQLERRVEGMIDVQKSDERVGDVGGAGDDAGADDRGGGAG